MRNSPSSVGGFDTTIFTPQGKGGEGGVREGGARSGGGMENIALYDVSVASTTVELQVEIKKTLDQIIFDKCHHIY